MTKSKEEKLESIKNELILVFNNHYNNLKKFKEIYLDPFEKNNLMTKEDFDFCFKDILQVFTFYSQMKNDIHNQNQNPTLVIIDIFEQNLLNFHIHEKIMSNLEEIVKKIEKLLNSNKLLRKYVEEVEKNGELDWTIKTSQELLIISGGRGIPRFVLLFSDLQKLDQGNEKILRILNEFQSISHNAMEEIKKKEELKQKEESNCILN